MKEQDDGEDLTDQGCHQQRAGNVSVKHSLKKQNCKDVKWAQKIKGKSRRRKNKEK